MDRNRRTSAARASVAAAVLLIAVKLWTGLAIDSLGMLSEAAHSGVDLVAALLVLFAVGVASRPADRGHPYGHGKAEHLSALAEATVLVAASGFIGYEAISRIGTPAVHDVSAPGWVFVVLAGILAIDASRATWNWRIGRHEDSAALRASAVHFAGDFFGTLVVGIGLLGARFGHPELDAWAALVVAVLVLFGAGRLARENIMVLMDTAPQASLAAARQAILRLPGIELRRLRLRQSAGRHFADVVVRVPGHAAVAQGHAAADDVEQAIRDELPGADVVVHVEPADPSGDAEERARAAALTVPGVRDVHNIRFRHTPVGRELTLHFRLPGGLGLHEAHEVSRSVESQVATAVPEADLVLTHIEPIPTERDAAVMVDEDELHTIAAGVIAELTGSPARTLVAAHVGGRPTLQATIVVDGRTTLEQAHRRAHMVEEALRERFPMIAEMTIHTEPADES